MSQLPTTHSMKSFKRRSDRFSMTKAHGTPVRLKGDIAIQAIGGGLVSAAQIEAARRSITRKTNRQGRFWRNLTPNHPVSGKPIDSRMGRGKGAIDYYTVFVRPGAIIFELADLEPAVAIAALKSAQTKLGIPTKLRQR